jgi:WD40 repeat protein
LNDKKTVPSTLPPEIRLKTAYEFAFSPDSKRGAYIGGRYVTILDIARYKSLFAVHPIANPSYIDFSPDGRVLVVKGTSGRTIILDAKTGRLRCDFRNQKEGEGDRALFTRCSRFVVSISWNGLFSVRDCKSTEIVFSQSYSNCQLTELSATADRSLFVYSVGGEPRSPDGLTPCTVALHRWPTRRMTAEKLPREWEAIWGLQVSPSGRFLALVHGTPPNTLEVFDIARSRTVARCRWNGSPGCSIAWSSDEKMIVTNADNCFRMHALPGLRVVRELPAQYPCFVQFSPSGEYLALGSWKHSFIIPTDSLADFGGGRSCVISRS